MFTRTTGLVIVPCWLAAMGWLIAHDVLPGWTAKDPPTVTAAQWLARSSTQSQFTIHDSFGPVGSVWTTFLIDERSVRREDVVWIERLPVDVAPLRVTAGSVFTSEGVLDEFTIRLESQQADVRLHGERFPADFSFRLESGPIDKAFKVPLSDGGLISGAFHPFGDIPNLAVGTRWRMQVVNPLALLTGVGPQFIPMLVEVTGEERITTAYGERNCMVVESPNARAWVGADGVVHVQEIKLPLVGEYRIVRQAEFDDDAQTRVRQLPLGPKRAKRR